MELYNPLTIKLLKNKYGFQFAKSFGQNFLIDPDVISGIADGAALAPEDFVLEIGPGIGVLTSEICQRAGRAASVEIDPHMVEVLHDTLAEFSNVHVIQQDVLKADLNRIIQQERGDCAHVKVLGNLPYYITTPIIMKLLTEGIPAECIVIMMQKEVADRIQAGPGSRTYGALSVTVQYYCTVSEVMEVPRQCFMPQPKVDSAVLRLDVRSRPAVDVQDEAMFFRCVKAGFSQRRKTLLNSLMTMGESKDSIRSALEQAGIDPRRRAETLSLEEFGRLSDAFSRQ
ncbi:MAG: 16S rRNA (adenine(1518)-N(6)/adenine(1519)-N(6))-dimethyltransferase RsmA [Clostridiales bacterium]|nr:16S rRNA (adenine(1518)-N(6)/adenine(1519)-N(6))-dimethyltransferase RsmA [Clostridiales bacterium]